MGRGATVGEGQGEDHHEDQGEDGHTEAEHLALAGDGEAERLLHRREAGEHEEAAGEGGVGAGGAGALPVDAADQGGEGAGEVDGAGDLTLPKVNHTATIRKSKREHPTRCRRE